MRLTAEHRLAVYGTLAPGEPNHHQMDGMTGEWIPGVVRGRLFMVGWGGEMVDANSGVGRRGELRCLPKKDP